MYNSSSTDSEQQLKERSIQTFSQVHFKSIQFDSNSSEPKFQFPFQFNVESIINFTFISMHFNTISSTFNSIQFKSISSQFNPIQFKINSVQTRTQIDSIEFNVSEFDSLSN